MTSLMPLKRRARDIRNEMWDSFTDFFSDNLFAPVRADIHQFRTDIKDCGDLYVIEAELPGFAKDEIKVEYNHQYLTISAKREAMMKEDREDFIRRERHFGEFVRRFFVEDMDEDAIDATFKDGILTLRCPKIMTEMNPQKRIEIHS